MEAIYNQFKSIEKLEELPTNVNYALCHANYETRLFDGLLKERTLLHGKKDDNKYRAIKRHFGIENEKKVIIQNGTIVTWISNGKETHTLKTRGRHII